MAKEWWPVFRMTPANGAAVTIRLREALQDFGGPVRCDVRYVPVIKNRENVNNELRPYAKGYRCEVEFDVSVSASRMADAGCLATITGWLADRTKTVELSMDDGVTFREIVLKKFEGPKPKAGKTFAGFLYELAVSCRALLEAPADIASGTATLAW